MHAPRGNADEPRATALTSGEARRGARGRHERRVHDVLEVARVVRGAAHEAGDRGLVTVVQHAERADVTLAQGLERCGVTQLRARAEDAFRLDHSSPHATPT